MNNWYCEMLGYSEAELRRKTLQDITHPDDWDRVLAGRHQLLAGEISSHTIEKRFIRKDGTIFWGRLHRSLVRDGDSHPRCVIALVEDNTENIHAGRALRGKRTTFHSRSEGSAFGHMGPGSEHKPNIDFRRIQSDLWFSG